MGMPGRLFQVFVTLSFPSPFKLMLVGVRGTYGAPKKPNTVPNDRDMIDRASNMKPYGGMKVRRAIVTYFAKSGLLEGWENKRKNRVLYNRLLKYTETTPQEILDVMTEDERIDGMRR